MYQGQPTGVIDRTVEAIVLDWHGAIGHRARRAIGTRVAALRKAGVDVSVLGRNLAAGAPPVLHDPGQPGRTVREILRGLVRRGIGTGLVLLISDELGTLTGNDDSDSHLPEPELARAIMVSVGTPPRALPAEARHPPAGEAVLLRLLDEQLRRRQRRRVPAVDQDAAWTIRETGADPLRHRVTETLFTLGAAGFATRGAVEEVTAGSVPLVLATGIYRGAGSRQHLMPAPGWTGLVVEPPPVEDVRVLDLRTGVLFREENSGDRPVRTLRLVSASIPGAVAMRAEAAVGRLRAGPVLQQPRGRPMTTGVLDHRQWGRVRADTGASIAAVASHRRGRDGATRTVERLAAYVSDDDHPPPLSAALEILEKAERLGFDRILAEHRQAWADRWEAVDVRIPDDPSAQLAARFALFQLWCTIGRRDEAAIGARGISGLGYAGHVFWDADVFVLPAVVTMDPHAAKAMIRYRLNRLPAARKAAHAAGRRGARFPWESAATGEDVTPTSGHLGGQVVRILTGAQEEHVTADVAWAAVHYAQWSGEGQFLTRRGRSLLFDTARYWASRCRVDGQGRAHIEGVIGPDEYHESVNDNAYTNVMARWNLRAAADLADSASMAGDERGTWRDLADRLVDGYDPATGIYQQFAGYGELEPLDIAEFARPPVAADVLLGRDRVAASQLIKQPDVLMLHHVVPDQVEPGSLGANLDFYGPRTAHGSSLSPAITAALLARAGRPDEALDLFRVALTLDLDDLTGTAASGLHLAGLGGVWQALLTGFAGVRVRQGILEIDPQLPSSWGRLELRFRCLGRKIRLRITPDGVEVGSDAPVRVRRPGLVGQAGAEEVVGS